VTGRYATEIAILTIVSAVIYGLGFEVQAWLFHFSEHMPGVSWFYLPAGLRVLLVLVFGLSGAAGIVLASAVINLMHMHDLNGAMLVLTAVASGSGAWCALAFMRWRQLISANLSGLTSGALLQYALLYSALNAFLHQAVWWLFQREGAMFMVDVWPMFIGDFLGALVFLYGWKMALVMRSTRASSVLR